MNEASTQSNDLGIIILFMVIFFIGLGAFILYVIIKDSTKKRKKLISQMPGPILFSGMFGSGKIQGIRHRGIPFKVIINNDSALIKNILIKKEEIKKIEIKRDFLEKGLFIEYSKNGISQPIMILHGDEIHIVKKLIEGTPLSKSL
ncbi:MAG: hypothetical protein GY754_12515 [bacterium]|nr:hypothetical protein [bacterium]